jgi:hypothetical protein
MVSELRTLASALDTALPEVKILRTRWYAEKVNAPLPAVIVDYLRPYEPLLLESGIDLPSGDFYYLEIAVKPESENDDPLNALERLENLVEQVKSVLHTAFPYQKVLLMTPETIEMPFGKQISLSFICDLYIG